MTQLNNEYDIKPDTGNSGCNFPLPHKNISGLEGDRIKKLDPEEGTSSTHHSS